MLMKKLGVLAVAALALSAAAFVFPQQDPNKLPQPLVTFRGEHSKVDKPRYVRITSKPAWAKLWGEHVGRPVSDRGYGWYYNQRQVPDIDFDQCQVVAVFGGRTYNNAGYRVVQVLGGDAWTVRFDANSYQTAVMDPDDADKHPPSTPFGMFVLPKSAKAIRMEENVQGLINQPPKWKLQTTL